MTAGGLPLPEWLCGPPSRGIDDRKELATPTGVALMCALADEFGPMPAINVTAVGYGAGAADIAGRAAPLWIVLWSGDGRRQRYRS
jgi:uncharacterized protein (DUF111 family)